MVDFESSYHAIFERQDLATFMVVPHYLYLLLKMLGPNGILSLQGDLKCSYYCDAEAIQIAAKAQAALKAQEITVFASLTSLEDSEILTKKAGIIAPPQDANVMKIDLGTGDPSKTTTISAHLSKE